MILPTVIGILILLIPYILYLPQYRNTYRGFAVITTYILAFEIASAITLQALGMATYSIILGVHVAALLALFFFFPPKHPLSARAYIRHIDWIGIGVISIALLHLIPIHYNYTGVISTIRGNIEVEGMVYPYPHYADEWYTIAFVQRIIQTQSLPFENPLMATPLEFMNFQFVFHSLVAHIMILLNLHPVTQYVFLKIAANVFLIFLAYSVLRHLKLGAAAALVAALSLLYITNGGAIPAFWSFISFTAGIGGLLLSAHFMHDTRRHLFYLASGITLLLYPPLIIFSFIFLAYSLTQTTRSKALKTLGLYASIVLGTTTLLITLYFLGPENMSARTVLTTTFSKLYYPTLLGDAIPAYSVTAIIPLFIILVAGIGIYTAKKQCAWLIASLGVSAIYWLAYSYSSYRLAIEYERIVILAALWIVLLSAFGYKHLFTYIRTLLPMRTKTYHIALCMGIAVLFVVLSFTYTQRNTWKDVSLYAAEGEHVFIQASPVNLYLHPHDLFIFANLENERFLSIPWKGTVIGTATSNWPVSIKAGTVTMNPELPFEFLQASCEEKERIAQTYDFRYAYVPPFDCDAFEPIKRSEENLTLYRHTPQ